MNFTAKVKRVIMLLVVVLGLNIVPIGWGSGFQSAQAADDSQFFPETGQTVSGKFLAYWRANGGLPTFGFPITPAQPEVDPETGRTFLTQWFERNRFELHPENSGTRYEILLGLLGNDLRREALAVDPDFARAQPLFDPAYPRSDQQFFEETGHNLRFGFLAYWRANGGLERFGFPISEVVQEVDPQTGKVYRLQWFERARFEYHPENRPPYDILLGLLGNELKINRPLYSPVWKLGSPSTRMSYPQTMALDRLGYLYLADTGNNRIHKFDSAGRKVNSYETYTRPGLGQSTPAGIAVDAAGFVYLMSRGSDVFYIQKYTPAGQFLTEWPLNRGANPPIGNTAHGLAVDEAGNIYACDRENGTLQKFDASGRFLYKFGTAVGPEGSSAPSFVAVDRQGNLYVTDWNWANLKKFDNSGVLQRKSADFSKDGQTVFGQGLDLDSEGNLYVPVANGRQYDFQKFDPNLNYTGSIGGFGYQNDQYNSPNSPVIDREGNIYLVDLGPNNAGIIKYDRAGRFVARWGESKQGNAIFSLPQAVAVDRQNNLYTINGLDRIVQKFDAAGRFVARWEALVEGGRRVYSILGLATDAQGNVYVSDNQNLMILKYDPTGKLLLKFGVGEEGVRAFNDVAVDSQGNIYVAIIASNYVRKYDPTGKFVAGLGSYGQEDNQFQGTARLAIDARDNLYVLDTGNRLVKKFDPRGQFVFKTGQFTTPGISLAAPNGLAVDRFENIYVGDQENGLGLVRKYQPDGQFAANFNNLPGTDFTANGAFGIISGLAVNSRDELYLTDFSNHRLVKLRQKSAG